MFILLDASVVAPYYLPRCARSVKTASRITTIFDSVRSGESNHFFYLPNFSLPRFSALH